VRTYGPDEGLEVPPVWALAQDSVGFIWIGAESGLFRFDGSQIRRWAEDRLPRLVMDVTVGPDGRIVVLSVDGRLWEVRSNGVAELDLPWVPVNTPRRGPRMLAFEGDGRLWVQVGDSIWGLGSDAPRLLNRGAFDMETPRGVLRASEGVLVLTEGGLWRAGGGREPERIYRVDASRREVISWATESADGDLLLLANVAATGVPRVLKAGADGVREVSTTVPLPAARAVSVLERNGTVWVAMDRFLAALRPGQAPEVLGGADGFESGGSMLVDREGSIWVGSFVGLHQFPEPDTRSWTERHGVPSRHTRYIGRSGDALWVMTWAGPGWLPESESGADFRGTEWDSRSVLCGDPLDVRWTASEEDLMRLEGSAATVREGPSQLIHGCTPHPDGGTWLGGPDALWWLSDDGAQLIEVTPPSVHATAQPRPALLHDSRDRLWIALGAAVCSAPAVGPRPWDLGAWTCEEVPSPTGLLSMAEVDEGRLWLAAGPAGLLEYDGTGWGVRRMPDVETQDVQSVQRSPRGGVWVVGTSGLARARLRGDGSFEVLERLTPWHGLGSESAGDVLELPSGDVWLATNRGVTHVPAAVRFRERTLPPVALVEAMVDGESVPIDGPLELQPEQTQLELRFAALSFRHRPSLRHQVRLSADAPWTDAEGDLSFRWVDLQPGTYGAEYRVSLDGVRWATTDSAFRFRVLPPWYETRAFYLLSALLAFALAAVFYRLRVGYLVGLERQRTQIAMDLHDQVGSGLASVGILSSVIASNGVPAEHRDRTARRIADVAEELGHSLSDIVWALDPQTASLEELGSRLREHGERLFPDDAVDFRVSLPDPWPGGTSSMAVRSAVLLIGLEALHNAARHAEASSVTLRMEPLPGGWWELLVGDDGVGLDAPAPSPTASGSGRGLPGMARRAASVGAELSVEPRPGGGTDVRLRFRPQEGRIGRWWETWRIGADSARGRDRRAPRRDAGEGR
jgi:signal transduction histidine kinase/ligand-binding sensor domain-containing protein